MINIRRMRMCRAQDILKLISEETKDWPEIFYDGVIYYMKRSLEAYKNNDKRKALKHVDNITSELNRYKKSIK